MSQHFASLKPGDTLDFKGPILKIAYKPNQYDAIGMVAGGTGITPMLQVRYSGAGCGALMFHGHNDSHRSRRNYGSHNDSHSSHSRHTVAATAATTVIAAIAATATTAATAATAAAAAAAATAS